ncbi:hypothetical protein V6251_12600 [Olleya sp. Ti.3.14]|uniref:hypothetical protein n=1 Tax=Olleya sp. Ti.3.14 TaxID=3121297 RepID=UPI00311EEC43
MNTASAYKIETHRRVCLVKDCKEANHWISVLELAVKEFEHFYVIEKQLIKHIETSNNMLALRRKFTLSMANFCKYEQEIINEIEYGKTEYNDSCAKVHELKRQQYIQILKELHDFRIRFYNMLARYKR